MHIQEVDGAWAAKGHLVPASQHAAGMLQACFTRIIGAQWAICFDTSRYKATGSCIAGGRLIVRVRYSLDQLPTLHAAALLMLQCSHHVTGPCAGRLMTVPCIIHWTVHEGLCTSMGMQVHPWIWYLGSAAGADQDMQQPCADTSAGSSQTGVRGMLRDGS